MKVKKEILDLSGVTAFLDDQISSKSFKDLRELQKWFEGLELQDWKAHIAYDEDQYKRIYLSSGSLYDLLLICWMPDQGSSFHPHPRCGCLVKILQGNLTEAFKNKDGLVKIKQYGVHQTIYICNEMGIHRVYNSTEEPAISLHLYAPGGYKP